MVTITTASSGAAASHQPTGDKRSPSTGTALDEAHATATDLAYGLARETYRL